ncbi:hypothetical protein QBZ16_004171 [Prototheca wickerhamii]|uniref:Cyanobacterial aminoacyl-tRNA synthetase CAAD domain-containing protein n=1 Tax=Prototheca wickerhamii TaxID=3111 RepID=A0AAD9MIE7_PROWI|nr:hypothetical protein QBZ16_004171 [Prototheca wickerhamii]
MQISSSRLLRPTVLPCRPGLVSTRPQQRRTVARSFNEVDSHATIEEPRKQVINLFNVASAPRSDLMSSVSGRAEELLGAAKGKWNAMEDKPTVIGTVAGGLLTLYIVSGILERLDALPGVSNVFQLLGFLTSGYAAFRYVASEEDRSKIHSGVKGLLKRVGL